MVQREIATLGGGCFWCLQAVYDALDGVRSVESGYMGGSLPGPSYRDVCTGETGHVEVVQITFEPDTVSYREILEVFFAIHDPTSRDRQGDDAGPQYRSVIFFHSKEQRATAETQICELDASGAFAKPIVTEVLAASVFYRAEDYHQDYFRNHPQEPYCSVVIAPKVRKLRERFGDKLKRGA